MIAKRALLQLGAGLLGGVAFGTWLIPELAVDELSRGANWPLVLASIAGFMTVVGVLVCVAPTLRALRIRPVEALKEG